MPWEKTNRPLHRRRLERRARLRHGASAQALAPAVGATDEESPHPGGAPILGGGRLGAHVQQRRAESWRRP